VKSIVPDPAKRCYYRGVDIQSVCVCVGGGGEKIIKM
jgi:hypothetical protein